MSEIIRPVILSGGSGTRLWPLSRGDTPKQLLRLHGDRTLLQQTVLRTQGHDGFAPPVVVAAADHRFQIAEQLREIAADGARLVLEPCPRNTGPAVFASAALIAAEDPEALLLVMPADHVIGDTSAFVAAVHSGAPAARAGSLVLFGVRPTRPATGYGYVSPAAPAEGAARRVGRFHEKPDAETARALIAGGALWNAGLFLMRARAVLEEARRLEPEAVAAAEAAVREATRDLDFLRLDEASFARAPARSFDYGVLERTEHAAVVAVDFPWTDVGAWSAVHALGHADADGNVLEGPVVAEASKNTYVRSEGPVVATLGVENLVVVAAPDAVLVADRGRDQEVRTLVERFRQTGRREASAGVRAHRPWGWYQRVDEGPRFQVKRIAVAPGRALSLQRHRHRSEHWVVVEGVAEVTLGDEVRTVRENESVYVPAGMVHRLRNAGSATLHLIEVQTGAYLGEDDIERLQDDYARP